MLGVDPFDEPNVAEAKQATRRCWSRRSPRGASPRTGPGSRPASAAAALRALLDAAGPADYFALLAYLHATPPLEAGARARARGRRGRAPAGLATTLGYGPRFLHSTGQLHKGGPDTGIYLQLTAAEEPDLAIPGERYGFGTLRRAQAAGDYRTLAHRGRRCSGSTWEATRPPRSTRWPRGSSAAERAGRRARPGRAARRGRRAAPRRIIPARFPSLPLHASPGDAMLRVALTALLALVLVSPALAQAPPDAQSLLQRAGDTYRALSSYHVESVMDVRQVTGDGPEQTLNAPLVMAGDRSGRVRLEVRHPQAGALVVSDGRTLSTYMSQLQQYTQKPAAARCGQRRRADAAAGLAAAALLHPAAGDPQRERRGDGEPVELDGQKRDCWLVRCDMTPEQALAADSAARAISFLWLDRERGLVLRDSTVRHHARPGERRPPRSRPGHAAHHAPGRGHAAARLGLRLHAPGGREAR